MKESLVEKIGIVLNVDLSTSKLLPERVLKLWVRTCKCLYLALHSFSDLHSHTGCVV